MKNSRKKLNSIGRNSIDVFSRYRISNLEIKNRFIRSATWDATADFSGTVTDNSQNLYRELGKGEIGLIVTGHLFVSALGQADHGQYGIHTDSMTYGLSRIVEVVHNGGTKIAAQVAHAGINSVFLADKGITVPAVSAMSEILRPHREMTGEDIEAVISDFGAAAYRAKDAGFDAIQIHSAHGYLLSQFISPVFNKRQDRWGGSIENRSRFHLEVIRSIRQAVGDDFPIMIKFGVQDDARGGLTLAEGIEALRFMTEAGIDAVEISAGSAGHLKPAGGLHNLPKGKTHEHVFFRERAAAVKRSVSIPVILVGGIRSPEMSQEIVDSGDADLISMCRPFIREPGLIKRWRRGDKAPSGCQSCKKCLFALEKNLPLECQLKVNARL